MDRDASHVDCDWNEVEAIELAIYFVFDTDEYANNGRKAVDYIYINEINLCALEYNSIDTLRRKLKFP